MVPRRASSTSRKLYMLLRAQPHMLTCADPTTYSRAPNKPKQTDIPNQCYHSGAAYAQQSSSHYSGSQYNYQHRESALGQNAFSHTRIHTRTRERTHARTHAHTRALVGQDTGTEAQVLEEETQDLGEGPNFKVLGVTLLTTPALLIPRPVSRPPRVLFRP